MSEPRLAGVSLPVTPTSPRAGALVRRLSEWPDLPGLHARAPAAFPVLLESRAGHPRTGRYDLLFGPVRARQRWVQPVFAEAGGLSPFATLDLPAISTCHPVGRDEPLPFAGAGWCFLASYEAARFVEPGLRLPEDPCGWPLFSAIRVAGALIIDRIAGTAWRVAEDVEAADALDALLAAGPAVVDINMGGAVAVGEDAPEAFLAAVDRARDYIAAGDIFQANLSRAWHGRLDLRVREDTDAAHRSLYARLGRTNPAPFAALWHEAPGRTLLSSSPERLVRVDADGRAETRPIAGTRPRGATGQDDAIRRAELLAHPKERAEHVMMIDLERNDLGRVCVPGSVRVDELMVVESYAHVHHLVSGVTGRLRPGIRPLAALAALFPGGTITGCPKVRCMEIIAELEGTGRGPYTGSLGYLSACGRLDSNILIRSLWLDGDTFCLRAGAGIVFDSVPAAELAETRAKARGLLRALEAG